MSKEYKECYLCQEQIATQTHHIILKSECKPLEYCEMNTVRLCNRCHDNLHHDRKGYIKLKQLKMGYQNKLEMLFDSKYLTREEIKEVLKIKDKPLDRLLKTLIPRKGMYERERIILKCMGDKLVTEEELEG